MVNFLFFQISPFPFDLVKREVERFPNAIIEWVQEEPKNMGSWFFVQPRIVTATNGSRIVRFVPYKFLLNIFTHMTYL